MSDDTNQGTRFSLLEVDTDAAPTTTPATPTPVVVPPVAPVAMPKANDKIIALAGPAETTGAVTYWSLSGDLDLAKMQDAWLALGLQRDSLPVPSSPAHAFHRACKALQTRDRLVRKHPLGGWQFVFEVTTSDGLKYEHGPRLFLSENSDEIHAAIEEDGGAHPLTDTLLAEVRADWRVRLTTVSREEVSWWLTWFARKMSAVSLRATGGVYFIPRDSVETWHDAMAIVASASSHRVFEIPAMKSADAIAAILDAMQFEISDLVTELQGELLEGMGPRAAATRLGTIDEVVQKIEGYERLLGVPMTGAREQLRVVREAVGKLATNTSQLEVE